MEDYNANIREGNDTQEIMNRGDFNYRDIINAASGTDIDKNPNGSIAVTLSNFESIKDDVVGIPGATLNIQCRENYMNIDIEFASEKDPAINYLLGILRTYREELTKIIATADIKNVPELVFTILPNKYRDKYYMTARVPVMWSVTPKHVRDEANCVRILFDNNDVEFFNVPEPENDDKQA